MLVSYTTVIYIYLLNTPLIYLEAVRCLARNPLDNSFTFFSAVFFFFFCIREILCIHFSISKKRTHFIFLAGSAGFIINIWHYICLYQGKSIIFFLFLIEQCHKLFSHNRFFFFSTEYLRWSFSLHFCKCELQYCKFNIYFCQ